MFAKRSSQHWKRIFRNYVLPAGVAVGVGATIFSVVRTPHASARNHPSFYDHHVHSNVEPIPNSKIPKRSEQLAALKSGKEYDVLVIGGGCVGSGIALDAISRGLTVALVERDDFASGTSSRSTKLIHGGVRYLEKAFTKFDWKQVPLVVDALGERRHLLRITPHLSWSIPIVVPIYHRYPEVIFYLPYYWIGMKMYDLFAGTQGMLRSSYYIDKQSLIEKFPMLNERGLKGGIVYFDGMHNDARMNLAIALTAAAEGAAVANHVEVTAFDKDSDGTITGVELRDNLTGDTWPVKSKVVVNATGPFCDSTLKLADKDAKQMNKLSGGAHVVLPDKYSPNNMGMLVPNTDDGRVIFLLPWEGSTIAGTTDSSTLETALPKPTKDEAKFIINEVGRYLNADLDLSDIDACWSGIRPLAFDPNSKDTQSISRDHVVGVDDKSGLVTITGGKWTTYRKMSEDVVNRIVKKSFPDNSQKCRTKELPLVGATGWSLSVPSVLQRKGFTERVADHLSHNYGYNAYQVAEIALDGFDQVLVEGYPYIEAEVIYCARHEYAQNTVDVISRRLRLAFLNTNATVDALPRVISLLAAEHKWDASKRAREYREAKKFLSTMNVHVKGRHECKWESKRAGEYREAKKFLSTMNVHVKGRHEWYKRSPVENTFRRIETVFGRSPFSADHIGYLVADFRLAESYERESTTSSSSEETSGTSGVTFDEAKKIIEAFSNNHRRFQDFESKMIAEVKSLENGRRIQFDEFVMSISAAIVADELDIRMQELAEKKKMRKNKAHRSSLSNLNLFGGSGDEGLTREERDARALTARQD